MNHQLLKGKIIPTAVDSFSGNLLAFKSSMHANSIMFITILIIFSSEFMLNSIFQKVTKRYSLM